MNKLRLVFISDTHTYHDQIDMPEGDIVIHSGDATYRGLQHEVESFGRWLRHLPHKHKIFVPGNHDISFERELDNALEWLAFDKPSKKNQGTCYYLHNELIEIEGLKIYGSGSTPSFGHGWAFNVDRGDPIAEEWKKIPVEDGVDILVTHGPPFGILDWTYYDRMSVGCEELMKRIYINPPLIHSVGHIHESRGVKEPSDMKTLFINSSICTLRYRPTNEPIVVDVWKEDDKWEYELISV